MVDVYIDTSALVKYYWYEDGSDAVNQLFQWKIRGTEKVYTSPHTIIEFASAAMRLSREGMFTSDEAISYIHKFNTGLENIFTIVNLTQELIKASQKYVIYHPLKAADALHLACAIEVNQKCNDEQVLFVSGDRQLLTAAANEYLNIWNPLSEEALAYLDSVMYDQE